MVEGGGDRIGRFAGEGETEAQVVDHSDKGVRGADRVARADLLAMTCEDALDLARQRDRSRHQDKNRPTRPATTATDIARRDPWCSRANSMRAGALCGSSSNPVVATRICRATGLAHALE